MKETILIFVATLKVKDRKVYETSCLKELVSSSCKLLGLTLRRTVSEEYAINKAEKAVTLIGFLDESHMILTTYPENRIIELEVASCKMVEIGEYIGWLRRHKDFEVKTAALLDKDDHGLWSRSV